MVIAIASLSWLGANRLVLAQVGGNGGATSAVAPPTQTPSVQSPTERGAGRALQGMLQGQDAGNAIRGGLGEAAQSAVETQGQTQLRDRQQNANTTQPPRSQIGQPMTRNAPNGTLWQQDPQGRAYYRDNAGRAVYGAPSTPSTQTAPENQYSASKPAIENESVKTELTQLRRELTSLQEEVRTMKKALTELMKSRPEANSENFR